MLDLETKVTALEEELSTHGGGAKKGKDDSLPKAPEKYSLTGHRNSINSVRFHPTFSLVASASEDATVKISTFAFIHNYIFSPTLHYFEIIILLFDLPWIWDYESGEFERSLRGHTAAIQDLDFDKTGNFLGMWSVM